MMELVCPAGTPASLRAAVDAGAHTVYCGFADETNARNFPGLNFSRTELAEQVWDMHFDSETNVVEVAVRRLRSKLDAPFANPLLHTVRGMGYVLELRTP